MGEPVTSFESLGKETSRALDAYAAERRQAVEQARRGYLERALGRREDRTRTRPRRLALAAAAFAGFALVTVLALIFGFRRAEQPLSFTADGQPAAVETWLAAPVERPLALAFSDGSALRVEPASRVRVVEVTRTGASVAVENGSLNADVVHTAESRWRVIAGPITVRVTGTRFNVVWSAPTEQFTLTVQEGSVTAAGSIIGAERAVTAGETLRVFVGERRLELSRASVPAPAALSATAGVRAGAPPPAAGELKRSEPPHAAPSAEPREPDWRTYAAQGSLRKAFAAAEASGFTQACNAASSAELLELGDGARLAGRSDRAEQALLALRKRFPRDHRRAAAAFALGKVAFDQRRNYGQAATWFRTSVAEQPSGSLAREASGRLIEALRNAGDSPGAREAAKQYLERYPAGPHADVARSLID